MADAIVFSVSKRRPGCVLLQVTMGGTVLGQRFHDLFPNETWLLAPTDDMRAYRVTDDQLEQLSAMAAETAKPRKKPRTPSRKKPRKKR